MKKLAATLCLAAMATGAFAQGTVNFANAIGLNISTNATAAPSAGGTAGITTGTAGGAFYYGLFLASSTVTTIDSSLQGLLTPTWTFSGVYGSNTATAGRLSGGSIIPGWSAAQFDTYLIVGWSANLGHDWTTIQNELTGATLAGNQWTGGNFSSSGGNAFLGASVNRAGGGGLPFGEPGGASGTDTFPTLPLFGTASTGTGTPATGFSLFIVTVPEPTSFALLGLGSAALMIFRRRK